MKRISISDFTHHQLDMFRALMNISNFDVAIQRLLDDENDRLNQNSDGRS